jgi:RNA ligase (TIGR02306 family)
MTERVMARVVRVDAINPIEGADKIELAQIGGWKVVVKKGEFQVDRLAVYCEIDSWIPHSVAPFLTKEGQFPKVYNNVEGQRLRTVKLRGQISQGLLLPIRACIDACGCTFSLTEDMDVTEWLGVQKWEPPAEFRAANAKGSFPHFIPKTDQERIQNLSRSLEKWIAEGHRWQVTEKVDGSSMTVFYKDGEVGCCSRNLELKDDGTSTFWETAKAEKLVEKLISHGKNIALQGELIGGNIQGNAYKVPGFQFHLYDIFDIDKQEYWHPDAVLVFALENEIRHVPEVHSYFWMAEKNSDMETLLTFAEGKSLIGAKPEREGLVFKSLTEPGTSFKVISNKWLLKNEG